MKWYTFRQNNSGGTFYTDKERGIAVCVIIQAPNARVANAIATTKGLYFNGCASGEDCDCCGDRWYPTDEYYATEVPMVYDKEVVACSEEESARDWGTYLGFMHPMEGEFSFIKYKE